MPVANRILPPVIVDTGRRVLEWRERRRFHARGRIPFTPGYAAHKERVVRDAIADDTLLDAFRTGGSLPAGFGVGVGERAVEYPWLLAQLDASPERVLDAGSALNHGFLLAHPRLAAKTLHVLTLAPEAECHWRRGVSYVYHDLRDVPYRDGFFDVVACVSTLEHVGFDNVAYTGNPGDREDDPRAFEDAMREMHRVLRPGGQLLLTVPYGKPEHHGTFRQFDADRLERAVHAFGPVKDVHHAYYHYTPDGWRTATADACADCEYVARSARPGPEEEAPLHPQPDGAAAARAVACVRVVRA